MRRILRLPLAVAAAATAATEAALDVILGPADEPEPGYDPERLLPATPCPGAMVSHSAPIERRACRRLGDYVGP